MFAGAIVTVGGLTSAGHNFNTAADAKAKLSEIVNNPNNGYKTGYECYVIDRTTHQIVSFAEVPLPKLEWQDAK